MNNHYTYLLILSCSLAGPLALSFDKKVGFYKKWKFLFTATLLPALFYITWDIFFTAKNVWRFNDNYISGIKLLNLPVEEVLFFFIVPYCCGFIYECVRCYFPNLKNIFIGNTILQVLALLLLITGLIFYNKEYTSLTFIFTACFIGLLYFKKKYFSNFDATSFLVAYVITLVPFLIVNGFLTFLPVVIYNNAQNLGLRIYTIPVEDAIYGMLLLLMNISIYEKLKSASIEDAVLPKK